MADPVVIQCPAQPDPCRVTVVHVIDWNAATAPLTPEHVADYMSLWMAFLVAAVAILGLKAVYKRFRIDYDH